MATEPKYTALPETLTARCCRGNTCTTDLRLISITPGTAPGEPSIPPLYKYVRGNDNDFSGDWETKTALLEWLNALEDD